MRVTCGGEQYIFARETSDFLIFFHGCPDNSYIVLKITITYKILIGRHKLDRWFNPTLGSYVIYVSFETNIFSFVLARFKSLQINLTYREEALDSLCVVKGVGLRGGGGGVELQVHLGQRADPLPHLLPCRPRLAGPVEGARNEVSDLVPPPLSLPEQLTVTGLVWLYELNTEYYFKRKSYLTVRYLIISSKSLNVLSSYLLLCSL